MNNKGKNNRAGQFVHRVAIGLSALLLFLLGAFTDMPYGTIAGVSLAVYLIGLVIMFIVVKKKGYGNGDQYE